MAHARQENEKRQLPRWVLFVALALAAALAVGMIALGVSRSRSSAGSAKSPALAATPSGVTPPTTSTAEISGSLPPEGTTDPAASPLPSRVEITAYPPGMRKPSTPDTTPPQGTPPPSMAGTYHVNFVLRADTCGIGPTPSTHDVAVSVDGETVLVTDRLTGNTLRGPGGSDGRFVVEYTSDSKYFQPRELMVGKYDGASISGNYFAYPRGNGCVVEYEFSGGR